MESTKNRDPREARFFEWLEIPHFPMSIYAVSVAEIYA
jgi:hypothetical protein